MCEYNSCMHLFLCDSAMSDIVLQSGRCHEICRSNLGCFRSLVENNDCGVNCKVSYNSDLVNGMS